MLDDSFHKEDITDIKLSVISVCKVTIALARNDH